MLGPHDVHQPPFYWNKLSHEERAEFIKLKNGFKQDQKMSCKDRRIVTFRKELLLVLRFLERSQENMEFRAVLVGVAFAGPVVCVNTRQLKSFLSRCKSSINGSFQQLGFAALRTKAKARSCVLAVLPSLQDHQEILRQWTVRYTSDDASFCFVSSFSHLSCPKIEPDDLFDERKGHPPQAPKVHRQAPQQHAFGQVVQSPVVGMTTFVNQFSKTTAHQQPMRPRMIEFDLQDWAPDETPPHALTRFRSSLSWDSFNDVPDEDFDDIAPSPLQGVVKMTRSQSANLGFGENDWSLFSDDEPSIVFSFGDDE